MKLNKQDQPSIILYQPRLITPIKNRSMFLVQASIQQHLLSAKMENISMLDTKTVVLEILEEFLEDAKLLRINYQVQEPITFHFIKIFHQKENIAFQTLKIVCQEVLEHLKEEMYH